MSVGVTGITDGITCDGAAVLGTDVTVGVNVTGIKMAGVIEGAGEAVVVGV